MSETTAVEGLLSLLADDTALGVLDALVKRRERELAALHAIRDALAGDKPTAKPAAPKQPPRPPATPAQRPFPKELTPAAKPATNGETATVKEAREKIARHVQANGPQRVEALRVVLGLSVGTFQRASDHDWFEREADGLHLTKFAYTELLDLPGSTERVEPSDSFGTTEED